MNPSTNVRSSLGNVASVSGTTPGPIRHEMTMPHRMTSPYVRPAASPQGVVMGSGQVITLKQLTPRQRPSILRRMTPGDVGVGGMTTTVTTTSMTVSPITSIPAPVIVSTGHSLTLGGGGQQQTQMQILSGVDGTYVPRLGSLPKIPGASLRKQDFSSDSADSSVPPAFTIVLGGIPPELVNRLFSSTNPNTARVFSAPPNNKTFSSKAAAVIAAPMHQSAGGSLFTDLQNGNIMGGRQDLVGGTNMARTQPMQTVVTMSSSITGLQEVDESSAAVAELASEQHDIVDESFEDLEDSIQITSA